MNLQERVQKVSTKPGVYLWKNKHGHVLYIGKAKNLRTRMLQYFKGAINSYKTNALMSNVFDFDAIIVSTNKEALLLERNLIQKHKPYYNILLTDDKKYPYIKISLDEKGLEISYQRLIKNKGANSIYYGPFPTGYGANMILRLLQRDSFFENGLPVKNMPFSYWKSKFDEIKKTLKFNDNAYLKKLEKEMFAQAEALNFEIAQELKEAIKFLKNLKEKQVVQLETIANIDVINAQEHDGYLFVTVLLYRYGILINKIEEILAIKTNVENTYLEYLNQFYDIHKIEDNIVMDKKFEHLDFDFDESTNLIFPIKGIYKTVLTNAQLNTDDLIKNRSAIILAQSKLIEKRLTSLKDILGKNDIYRIALIDNSHESNINPVSATVSYLNGIKNKNEYRKFNLSENAEREADVEYMKEGSKRFLIHAIENNIVPDLFIVDGSYAQLHEVKKVALELNLNIDIIALSKDENHKTKYLIDLDERQIKISDKNLLSFLSEMQEEVDRFAKSHYRKRKALFSLEGDLLKLDKIGPKRAQKLLKHFGNYANIYNATFEELEKVISKDAAKVIVEKFGNR
ncbi:excinuclease ABC subunit C [Mycoplasma testudineum]|uniref:Excinuclease cho n=1 Tax=Mycoplasma testudineum TaxID=244584 RepID=A0A4R6IG29_9MOLU|nr:GIY-YIG nuclease family protein [Mycoplasma testudineum]OYD26759.1 excinuclease ABC subunit C [Mycoplasma testudineum]TDO19895.1 excinuclease ABC subunit C [Mycoplasma testudineum]